MCRKQPTFSHRLSDVYLIRLGMGWNRIFPHLSTFEGPHKASLDHRADLGEAFCEFGTWLPTFGFFYVSSTAFPTNVAKRIFFLFCLRLGHQHYLSVKSFMRLGLDGLHLLSKPFIS